MAWLSKGLEVRVEHCAPERCIKVWQTGINMEGDEEERLAETRTYNE
jgi:hypothetical protein